MKRIYISGKITGLKKEIYTKNFNDAEKYLRDKYLNIEVVNPLKLNHSDYKIWEDYMKVDIKALMDCTHIYLLDNWIHSKGAIMEYEIASKLGIELIR